MEEKVWCAACEEERWMRQIPGGYKCGVCLTFTPAEAVILAEDEYDPDGA